MIFRHMLRRTVSTLPNDIISQPCGNPIHNLHYFITVDYTYIRQVVVGGVFVSANLELCYAKNLQQGGRQFLGYGIGLSRATWQEREWVSFRITPSHATWLLILLRTMYSLSLILLHCSFALSEDYSVWFLALAPVPLLNGYACPLMPEHRGCTIDIYPADMYGYTWNLKCWPKT